LINQLFTQPQEEPDTFVERKLSTAEVRHLKQLPLSSPQTDMPF